MRVGSFHKSFCAFPAPVIPVECRAAARAGFPFDRFSIRHEAAFFLHIGTVIKKQGHHATTCRRVTAM
jgi:hypothetical protein